MEFDSWTHFENPICSSRSSKSIDFLATKGTKDTKMFVLFVPFVAISLLFCASGSRFRELPCINRDIGLNFGQRVLLAPADPAVGELEWHHDTGNRTIIRIVPLRRDTPHCRSGVAYDASQQAGLLVEIECRDHAVSTGALNDINVPTLNRAGETDAPVWYGLLDPRRK